jgi:nucleotide-binding universal stress UspA family protein
MKILYATDGRPPAVAAGELLMKLVDPGRVTVTILHALEYRNEAAAESYAATVLDEAEDDFRRAGIATNRLRVAGEPASNVAKELAEDDYDLTVLGAGNHSWLGRMVFGSVSTYVLHEAPTPVLVVHRAPDPSHERLNVLIGADGSPSAAQAVVTLTSITEPDRVEVHVRAVIPTPYVAFAGHPGAYVPTSYIEGVMGEQKAIATGHLNDALDGLGAKGFRARGTLGTGWPANDLLDHGEKNEMDLIVVGARGIDAIARVTMGSVSAHVARHAPAALVAHAEVGPTDSEST